MRALRQEPDQRWVSVEQMAAWVRRQLAGAPLEARRGSVAYRAAKFVHRNRVTVLVAAVLGAVVLSFVVLASWQASLRAEERDLARQEQIKAETVNNLAGLTFVQGDLAASAENFRKALAILRSSRRDEHPEVQVAINRQRYGEQHRQMAISLGCLAKLALAAGRPEEALRHVREAEAILAGLLPEGHWRRAEMESLRGEALGRLGQMDRARELLTRSLARIEEVRGKGSLVAREAADRLHRLDRGPS